MQELFKSENMDDFIKFRKMITPVIIQVLFWVGAVGAILSGLFAMATDTFFGGLLIIILGPVVVRIYCELLILLFRMNETLTEIKNGLSK